MELFDIIGLVIIVVAALRGLRRGFVVTLGRLCAGILSLLLVYLLNTWAFAQLVPTLLVDHQVVVVRVLLCIILYIVLFLVLKTIILSLRILTGLPIIKGLNKLLGFGVGAAYGILLVGVLRMLQNMLPIF
ncbi:CvpA family protein [Kineothrix sp. MSJ-39]|uniref:CvpA family protein n=1 Tax=Kineothrix sp. MSJ-39 TaxID=2841533 RepID=UPI001C0F659B|nr:CvpA family protein [Kineothrix sp. MSJ-39]MBU5430715.1 CvpA family protein [Kineothrix sp. MSJ-39]